MAPTCCSAPPRLRAGFWVRAQQRIPSRVVITGGTKGLGLALAGAFLQRGASVFVCSRSVARVEETVTLLRGVHGAQRVHGIAADVSSAADVDALATAAKQSLGGVDVWLNNAGSNGYLYAPLVDTPSSKIAEVVTTNLLGTLLCTRAAMQLMQSQPGGGHVFNMEGAGSDGRPTPKYAAYGASKAGFAQLAQSLQAEVGEAAIGIHNISPGLVQTELVSSGRDSFGPQGRWFINALSELPEDVADVIAPMVLELAASPRRAGEASRTVRVLTPQVALQRILARLLLGKNKGRWYPED